MNNGLCKERMTVFPREGIAYQGFNTILGGKILGYTRIDQRYVCFSEVSFPGKKIDQEFLNRYANMREITNSQLKEMIEHGYAYKKGDQWYALFNEGATILAPVRIVP